MIMGKCKNCNSWKKSTTETYPPQNFGKCQKLRLTCLLGQLEDSTCIYLEGTDSEIWPVESHFGENFGCIHFEEREAKNE